jgi:hypothetical protein
MYIPSIITRYESKSAIAHPYAEEKITDNTVKNNL